MDNEFRRSIITTSIILVATTILIATFSLGYILTEKSAAAMRKLMDDHMMSVSNTAAAMLDGDELANITGDDKESDEYREVLKTLSYFRDNIELDYIYTVKKAGNDTFVYLIDPDTDDPAEYGEQIQTTDALIKASEGTAAVDTSPHSDKWGRFYSAYSPVFNGNGEVKGIVGVDFNAEWYESQIMQLSRTTFAIGFFSLLMGAVVIVLITARSRKNLKIVHHRLNELNDNIEELIREVGNITDMDEEAMPQKKVRYVYEENEMDNLGIKILSMQEDLSEHISQIRERAYIDGMTGARNKTAYLEDVRLIEEGMAKGSVDFSIVVFDLISLKNYNDNYGHEVGDKAITDAAKALIEVFGRDNVYRIGGDEFVAGLRFASEDSIRKCFENLEEILRQKNLEGGIYQEQPLGISKGYAVYQPGEDKSFNDVFRRADKMMYADKAAYYMSRGDRRRKRD